MTIEIRTAASRGETQIGWLDSKHSFSFGSYVDRTNTGHGLLLVSNDDRVAPATGFGTHGHADMEIITWVLSGEVEHSDTLGNHGIIRPGLAQRMSAGTGIRHSEHNPSPDVEAHFVQMWVPPDTQGIEPGYEQQEVGHLLDGDTNSKKSATCWMRAGLLRSLVVQTVTRSLPSISATP